LRNVSAAQHLFSSERLSNRLEAERRKLESVISQESDDYILSVNEAAYVVSLVSRFNIDELQLFPDKAYVAEEGDKPISFESWFGGTATRNVHHVTFAVPWSGPRWLLHCQADTISSLLPCPEVSANSLTWIYSTENRSPEEIKREFDSEVRLVANNVGWINEMVRHWNTSIRGQVEPLVRNRKERLTKGKAFVQSFGLPVRARGSDQTPLPVPVARKQIAIPKPSVPANQAERARVLDDTVYEQILDNLRNMNLVIERNPTAFSAMDEETLRCHFLVQLNNNFESAATGETFSKKGKTDIFLPADGRAAFIAECKFWGGPSSYPAIIDQLLSYLTWRDTKTAILLFVRNKDFSSVKGQIQRLTKEHPQHVSFLGEKHPGEFRFLLRSRDASNELLMLAVMCFHLPAE
jgi:hypothetical protein